MEIIDNSELYTLVLQRNILSKFENYINLFYYFYSNYENEINKEFITYQINGLLQLSKIVLEMKLIENPQKKIIFKNEKEIFAVLNLLFKNVSEIKNFENISILKKLCSSLLNFFNNLNSEELEELKYDNKKLYYLINKNENEIEKENFINIIKNNKLKRSNDIINYNNKKKIKIEKNLNESSKCLLFNAYHNDRNSCYIDTAFFILFTVLKDFFIENIISKEKWEKTFCSQDIEQDKLIRLNIKKKILDSIEKFYKKINIKEILTCVDLRKIFKECIINNNNYNSDKEQDITEFFIYIFNLFEINTMNINTEVNNLNNEFSSVNKKIYPIKEIILSKEIKNENQTIKLDELIHNDFFILQSEILLISIFRITTKGILKNKILPLEQIELIVDNKPLNLVAIILYNNSHFTCVFLCENFWYYYNDIPNEKNNTTIELYAYTYDEMIKKNNYFIQTNGLIYIYNKTIDPYYNYYDQ